jgi:hypothetical protein
MALAVRLGYRTCCLITLASGTAAARLAADFRVLGETAWWLRPLAVVLQLPIVVCWLFLRPISCVAFAGAAALATRLPAR